MLLAAVPAVAATNKPPVANAGPDRTGVVNSAITFSGSASTDPDGTIVAYWWQFGDGGSVTTTTPSATHAYSVAKPYILTLWVRDNSGAWSATADTANVLIASAVTTSTTTTTHPSTTSTSTSRPTTTTTSTSRPSTTSTSRPTTTTTSTSRPSTTSTSTTRPSTTTTTQPVSTAQWARSMGGSDVEVGDGVAVDGAGGRFVAGSFRGSARVGNVTLNSAGASDAFLVKYDAAGNVLWAKRFGGSLDDIFTGIATDAAGDVVAVGRFQGSAPFGGTALVSAGNSDIVVAKYRGSDGAHLWSHGFGDASIQSAEAVAVDPSGNALVTGYFAGSVDFKPGVVQTPYVGDYDVFVAKFSSGGATVWAKGFPNTGNEYGYAIATDGAGNVAVTGNFNNTINFGAGDLVSPPYPDAFLVKLNANGGLIWAKSFGGADGGDSGEAVAMDTAGNVVIGINTNHVLNLGGGNLSVLGGTDVVIGKFTASGASVWSRRLGGQSTDQVASLAIDGSGNVLVAGNFRWTAAFGGASLTSAGVEDGFVAKYTSSGGFVWAKQVGGLDGDWANAVAAAPSGDVYAAGTFNGSGFFAGTVLTSAGYGDAFLVHYLP